DQCRRHYRHSDQSSLITRTTVHQVASAHTPRSATMPEFPVDGPIAATARIAAGSIRFVAETRNTVEVDVRPGSSSDAARQAAAETIVEMTADGLIIETPQARGFLIRKAPSIDITVRLPSDSRIMVRSASADIVCDGRLGSANINSASGDLRIDHVA